MHTFKSAEERSVVAGACGVSAAGSARVKRAVCVLCSSAVDEPSSSADALQHCLQNLVGARLSVLCSSARAGVGDVVLCSSFRESKQARSARTGSRALQQALSLHCAQRSMVGYRSRRRHFLCWNAFSSETSVSVLAKQATERSLALSLIHI